jgi:hypothetical protein
MWDRQLAVRATDVPVIGNISQLGRKAISVAGSRHIKAGMTYLSFIAIPKERYCRANSLQPAITGANLRFAHPMVMYSSVHASVTGARDRVVGSGTKQAGRSRTRFSLWKLDFFNLSNLTSCIMVLG